MLAGRDSHRDFVLANQVVGHTYVVKVVHFDHQVVDAAVVRDSKGHCVVTIVAMHEYDPCCPLAAAELVLDAAAHPEVRIESLRSVHVALADDAMSHSAGAGLETSMHRATGMERLAELSERAVKNLDRIAVWVVQLQHFEHSTFFSLLRSSDAELDSRLG